LICNIVAHELESHSVRTFSAKEMAFNILGLMHPLLFSITQVEPIWADLNGGMDRLPDLADITTRIRSKLNKKAGLRRAIARDNSAGFKIINGVETRNGFKMIFSKKRKLLVVKRCPMSVLTYNYFPVSSIRLRDGSIFSYYHQVDPSKFRFKHSPSVLNYSNLSVISVPPPFNLYK
jgi:hypothetical protein